VTALIDPMRLTALRKRYNKVVDRDPMTLVGALIGTGIHELFESRLKTVAVYNPKYVLERSVQDIVRVNDRDLFITGRFDILYDQKHMTDIKSCSTWKKIFSPKHEDWTLQQNLYAYLLHRRGVDVETLNVLAVYKDWSEGNAARDRSYPQTQVENIPLPLWDFNETGQILQRLVQQHVDCEEISDDDLPECPAEDRWERFPGGGTCQHAIMSSTKAKRADRVFGASLEEVFEYVKERQAGRIPRKKPLPKTAFIEVRHAQRKRCEKYCAFNTYCNHYQTYLQKKNNHTLNDTISLEVIL